MNKIFTVKMLPDQNRDTEDLLDKLKFKYSVISLKD